MTLAAARTVDQDFRAQPEALAVVLDGLFGSGGQALEDARLAIRRGRTVIVTGMGGSYNVALPLVSHLAGQGIAACLVETGELVRHRLPICHDAVIVAVSQSGDTIETCQLLDAVAGSGAFVIGVTNEAEGTLARRAAIPLIVGSPRDKIVAMQTYLGSMAVLLALAGRDGLMIRADFEPAVDVLRAVVAETPGSAPDLDQARHVYLFGRGPSFGSAATGALLFHEIARLPATAMTGANFRHGPVEAIGPDFRAIGFAADDADLALNLALKADVRRAGGMISLIGPGRDISYPPLPGLLAPLVEIAPVQRAALSAARARGLVPGEFRFSSKVTRTESGLEGLIQEDSHAKS